MERSNFGWSNLFSAVQAACALVVTVIAVWGVFFTSLPETLIRQLRTDVSTAQEELIDLRRQQRAAELQYEAAQTRLQEMESALAASEKEVRGRRARVVQLQSHGAELERELEAVQEARDEYFRQTYSAVLAGMFSSIRLEMEGARGEAAQIAQCDEFSAWIANGEQLLGFFAEEDQAAGGREPAHEVAQRERDQRARWNSWMQEIPSSWSYIYRQFSTNTFHEIGRLFSGDRTARPESEYRAEDLALARRELMLLLEEVQSRSAPPVTGRSLLLESFERDPLNLLLPSDRQELKGKVTEFLVRESPAVVRPVRAHVPNGASAALIVHEGKTVLSHLDDLELLVHRLEQYLFQDGARLRQ